MGGRDHPIARALVYHRQKEDCTAPERRKRPSRTKFPSKLTDTEEHHQQPTAGAESNHVGLFSTSDENDTQIPLLTSGRGVRFHVARERKVKSQPLQSATGISKTRE